jgi:tRNA (guanine-N7-)-methyltransferase
MGRGKSMKFADNDARYNIIQSGKELFETVKGNWGELYFKNDNDIVLELACGRGEYTVGLAREFPNRNFIGIDIKGARIWNGSGIAEKENLNNVAFLRVHIQNVEEYFAPKEVSEIWVVHPDPRPKKSDRHRRLTHPRFLEIYKNIICKDGIVRLKTDNTGLYEYTLEILNERNDIRNLEFTDDLYNSSMYAEHYGIKTRYEEEFTAEGHDIKYLKFSFAQEENQT